MGQQNTTNVAEAERDAEAVTPAQATQGETAPAEEQREPEAEQEETEQVEQEETEREEVAPV